VGCEAAWCSPFRREGLPIEVKAPELFAGAWLAMSTAGRIPIETSEAHKGARRSAPIREETLGSGTPLQRPSGSILDADVRVICSTAATW